MTRAELIARTFERLEESSTSPVFWSEDDIADALNEGYQEMSDAAEWFELWRTVDLCAERPYYDVRTIFEGQNILTPGRAFHEDTNRWLEPCSCADLDRKYRRWEQVTGAPEKMLIRGLWWLGYWPATGSESGTVKQYATALPDALDDDDDEPGFDEAFHEGPIEYALSVLLPQAGEVSAALEAWGRYLGIEAGLTAHVQGRGSVPQRHGYGGSAVPAR